MKSLKQEMLKAAEKRFVGLPKAQRKAAAKVLVDRHIAITRREVKKGQIYVGQ